MENWTFENDKMAQRILLHVVKKLFRKKGSFCRSICFIFKFLYRIIVLNARIRQDEEKKQTRIRTPGSSGIESSHVRAVYNHANHESVRHAVLQRSYLLSVQKRHVRRINATRQFQVNQNRRKKRIFRVSRARARVQVEVRADCQLCRDRDRISLHWILSVWHPIKKRLLLEDGQSAGIYIRLSTISHKS